MGLRCRLGKAQVHNRNQKSKGIGTRIAFEGDFERARYSPSWSNQSSFPRALYFGRASPSPKDGREKTAARHRICFDKRQARKQFSSQTRFIKERISRQVFELRQRAREALGGAGKSGCAGD